MGNDSAKSGSAPHRIIGILFLLIGIFLAGTAGYILIERWSFFDALYMTVITLTTVGYGEVHPLSYNGRVFTIFLLLSGFGILTYGITSGISFLLEGELGQIMRRKKMEKQIQQMKSHYIICAAGETGDYAVEEFIKTKQPIVLVSTDRRMIDRFSRLQVPLIAANPAEDETLIEAGIREARGLVALLGEDKDNLFVVLSARGLNPGIKIVTQAIEESAVVKHKKAGADEVVLTGSIGGMRVASVMLRPTVVTFLDTMLRHSDGTLRVEEASITATSALRGKTIGQCDIADRTGVAVVAVKAASSGAFIHSSLKNYALGEGDAIIVIGTPEQILSLRSLIAG